MNGIERIAAERQRQIDAEGWTPRHDSHHDNRELVGAAICYAASAAHLPIKAQFSLPYICGCREAQCPHSLMEGKRVWRDPWPWGKKWDKRNKHSSLRQLEIAGALIAAEIDRLQRKEQP